MSDSNSRDWVTLLTTRDLNKATTANALLLQQGIAVRFFQVPPFELQVGAEQLDAAKAFLKEWELEP